MAEGAYLDLDGAFEPGVFGLPTVNAREWGPVLRYVALGGDIERFSSEVVATLPSRVLFGSGDFHHLSGVLVRRWAARAGAGLTLVSFDNHPDWDIRPPRWGCGGWVSRALGFPNVTRASIWGCGNFELAFPARLFRDQKALRSDRLHINAWTERQSPRTARRFNCMTRGNWRERFEAFAERVRGKSVYITVDLDCLGDAEIVTNWENGLFSAEDVAWAVNLLHRRANVVAGDVCGSRTVPRYARWFQRFAGHWDHPKLPAVSIDDIRTKNLRSITPIWHALTGAGT